MNTFKSSLEFIFGTLVSPGVNDLKFWPFRKLCANAYGEYISTSALHLFSQSVLVLGVSKSTLSVDFVDDRNHSRSMSLMHFCVASVASNWALLVDIRWMEALLIFRCEATCTHSSPKSLDSWSKYSSHSGP